MPSRHPPPQRRPAPSRSATIPAASAAGARPALPGAAPAPSPRSVRAQRTAAQQDARSRIRAAAIAAFSENGFAGARVDDIAARADVNKRMLYHYFGNKEALWLAALEGVYAVQISAENALDLANAEPLAGMRNLVAFLWDFYLAHPEFVTLINTENLHRARYLRRSAHVPAMHSRLIAGLESLLARGRAERVFRADVDPVQLFVTCAALAYFYQSNCHTLSTVFGRDLMSARARARRLAHITDVVLSYLTPT